MSAFRGALADAGQPCQDEVVPDARLHRYSAGGKRGKRPCWYFCVQLTSGHLVARYGDWRTGQTLKWESWETGLAAASAAQYHAEYRRISKQKADEQQREHREAAQRAKDDWARLSLLGESAYLLRKRVGAYGIRFGADAHGRFIAIPLRQGAEWRGIQRIYDSDTPDNKRHSRGCHKEGAYALVGNIEPRGSIYVCEGYATAATIFEATGSLCVCAFDAYNIIPVVEYLLKRERIPRAQIVVCPDNDQWTAAGNTGARIAEDMAYRFTLRTCLPDFLGLDVRAKPTDFNDLAALAGKEEVARQLAGRKAGANQATDPYAIPKVQDLAITDDEFHSAKLSPRGIVRDYLYADTALLLAAGATGKTTLQLYEAVHIVLGRPLYGFEVVTAGSVLIVTAEDAREILVARLREIVLALSLTANEQKAVQRGIRILDLSAQIARLVVSDMGNNLQLTPLVDGIIHSAEDDPPVLIVFDPAISFGAGESRVNDNEQMLVTASRRIVRALNCCVRYVHHIGKEAARSKIMDQYAGRSGSALPDGSRMVVVLQPWTEEEPLNRSPPQALTMTEDSQVILLNRPKLSYAPPQGLTWIKRRSYAYEYAPDMAVSTEAKLSQNADQIERFLVSELKLGRRYSQNNLFSKVEVLHMTQKNIRDAVSELKVSGRVSDEPMAKGERGGQRTYLRPVCSAT